MATKNLSEYDASRVPNGEGLRVAVLTSEWNPEVTGGMERGAVSTLRQNGVRDEDIDVRHVPGSFELVQGARRMAFSGRYDAVICLGCVIRGGTPHFDYVCQGTTAGLAYLNAVQDVPVIFGLLTCDDQQQALDRAGGRLGNKGDECAVVAIRMARLA